MIPDGHLENPGHYRRRCFSRCLRFSDIDHHTSLAAPRMLRRTPAGSEWPTRRSGPVARHAVGVADGGGKRLRFHSVGPRRFGSHPRFRNLGSRRFGSRLRRGGGRARPGVNFRFYGLRQCRFGISPCAVCPVGACFRMASTTSIWRSVRRRAARCSSALTHQRATSAACCSTSASAAAWRVASMPASRTTASACNCATSARLPVRRQRLCGPHPARCGAPR